MLDDLLNSLHLIAFPFLNFVSYSISFALRESGNIVYLVFAYFTRVMSVKMENPLANPIPIYRNSPAELAWKVHRIP